MTRAGGGGSAMGRGDVSPHWKTECRARLLAPRRGESRSRFAASPPRRVAGLARARALAAPTRVGGASGRESDAATSACARSHRRERPSKSRTRLQHARAGLTSRRAATSGGARAAGGAVSATASPTARARQLRPAIPRWRPRWPPQQPGWRPQRALSRAAQLTGAAAAPRGHQATGGRLAERTPLRSATLTGWSRACR